MEQRDWNELPTHCLIEILGKVGIESLVGTIPFVCKSWYNATFYPQCWQRLVFTKSPHLRSSKFSIPILRLRKDSRFDMLPYESIDEANDSLEKLVHFAIGRSHGLVTEVVFHPRLHLKEGQIMWIAQRCPSLKLLVLPSHLSYVINFEVSDSICNWKGLEGLQVASLIGLKKSIININKNCRNFNHLCVYVPRLDGDVASVIASQLPDIKTLDLRFSTVERDDLVAILKGCRKLEYLDVSECKGVACDNEILKLAGHIRIFKHEGSCVS
ncbi:F-box/LRR-repeat protein At3g48880-like isoform X1 [Cynara cardunculus var. scolymus]|uniref:F-box/LRR-repeat protein At3g48880-like isoform X1 n=1 Tax=Cynara cardunculus var. scolymus TaxID=59895 RepID=UPI000D629964|nr:F-box/LRR-repeat protein At3g48880-like isoform X1 [Cynara cardunculus var. scolymus]XP_024986415.1 F-box/LRR-repeat protein At3g48880-like isoform X1 [Cynara cardunculus var. scolymus]